MQSYTRDGASNHGDNRPQKRKRLTYSCLNCRRRKLKCDREMPCSRCRQAGDGNSCNYGNSPSQSLNVPVEKRITTPSVQNQSFTGDNQTQSSSSSSAQTGSEEFTSQLVSQARMESKIETKRISSADSESRRMILEAPFSSRTQNTNIRNFSSPGDHLSQSREQQVPHANKPLFKRKGFEIQFYGSSTSTNTIAQLPELREFMDKARGTLPHHSTLNHYRTKMKNMTKLKAEIDHTNSDHLRTYSTDKELMDLLPARSSVDLMIEQYLSTFELFYCVLDESFFRQEYQIFWERPERCRTGFIAVILLTMAAVVCCSQKEPFIYTGVDSTGRKTALEWIRAAESWLDNQSKKHTTLGFFQVHCLLLIAKQMNMVKMKQNWVNAGSVFRIAMMSGFHRNPKLLADKISDQDQSMRNRLWLTIIELELQASFDRGMPSASAALPSDYLSPHGDRYGFQPSCTDSTVSHILNSESLPPNRFCKDSFSLRCTLNSLINNTDAAVSQQDRSYYDEKLLSKAENLENYFQPKNSQSSKDRLVFLFLDNQLRQYFDALYAPFARSTGTTWRNAYSRVAYLHTATKLIEQHHQLVAMGRYELLLLRDDIVRVGLGLCHVVFSWGHVPEDPLFQGILNSFRQLLEKALLMLEAKVLRLGCGYKQYWYLSAGYSFVLSTLPGAEERKFYMNQALDRVALLYQKVLAAQSVPELEV
ncbi:hypothetical protein M501DRAFT_930940 [Patellaria atrata CBS 101060]|uniref:Zn(2)-C6 fungal-type domain-containing protein n=1 Tax=Patellaria atrata CBS 101060 TaxID=1346257 RepID=A0A9P4SG56_9PEZI|nr:hypothetical protein M501DRAFT_930940 [Patellaria atrata CBS 101060]